MRIINTIIENMFQNRVNSLVANSCHRYRVVDCFATDNLTAVYIVVGHLGLSHPALRLLNCPS